MRFLINEVLLHTHGEGAYKDGLFESEGAYEVKRLAKMDFRVKGLTQMDFSRMRRLTK